MQNIRDIAVVSHELFDLNTFESSEVDTTGLASLIHGVVSSNIHFGDPDQPLDEVIDCLRAARKHRPDPLDGGFALAISLMARYFMTHVNDDYKDAASILDEIIANTSLGDPQDIYLTQSQERATGLITALAGIRSTIFRTPEYLEEAIYRIRMCGSSSSRQEFPLFVLNPEATSTQRSRYFGSIKGVEESSGAWLDHPLSSANPTLLEHSQIMNQMQDLLFGICNNDNTTKIDEDIEKGRSILASSSSDESILVPSKSTLASFLDLNKPILDLFGQVLFAAFDCTNKIEYLNESISVCRQLIKTPLPQNKHFGIIHSLSYSLLACCRFFPNYCTQDASGKLDFYFLVLFDAFWCFFVKK